MVVSASLPVLDLCACSGPGERKKERTSIAAHPEDVVHLEEARQCLKFRLHLGTSRSIYRREYGSTVGRKTEMVMERVDLRVKTPRLISSLMLYRVRVGVVSTSKNKCIHVDNDE
jgi:hypothetical protein